MIRSQADSVVLKSSLQRKPERIYHAEKQPEILLVRISAIASTLPEFSLLFGERPFDDFVNTEKRGSGRSSLKVMQVAGRQLRLDGTDRLVFSAGVFLPSRTLRMESIRGVTRYRDLVLIEHDGGLLEVCRPFGGGFHLLLDCLRGLPHSHYREIDADRYRNNGPAAARLFHDAPIAPAGLSLLLAPGFLLASLARRLRLGGPR